MAISPIGSDSSLFSGMLSGTSGTSVLGDYALIKSGSYKKLLNAYYKKTDGTNSKEATEADKLEKKNLVLAKDAAVKMAEASKKLKNLDLSEGNRENIKKTVKEFVDAYNGMVDAGADVDNTSVLKNTLWMTQTTAKNAKVLDEIGISVGENNKLVLDEEKLDKARMTSLSTIFKGAGGIADKMLGRATKIGTIAASAAQQGVRASNYTNNGDFKSLTTSSIYDALI